MLFREAVPGDVEQLLALMADLARFEDYIDDFAVTKEAILANGFGPTATFKAFVCEQDGELIGMAVTYVVPWTYTLKPKLILKELFVAEEGRGLGVGKGLMQAVTERARDIGADHVAWTVMQGNHRAEAFYAALGGQPDEKWENWILPIA